MCSKPNPTSFQGETDKTCASKHLTAQPKEKTAFKPWKRLDKLWFSNT